MLLASMIILLFLFVFLGMDIAFAIGVASLAYIGLTQFDARPINPVLFVQELTAGVDSFTLLAIPMFIFVGELMTKAGVTRRLISLATSLVGHRPGGLANVGITGNLFMAGISGSAVADAAAIGSVLIPEMKRRGYSARYSAGVISAAACMAPIIPPSIMFILLGSIANLSVGELFIAGILPGLVMFAALIVTSGILARRYGLPVEPKVTGPERRAAILAGLLPLGAPLLIVATKVLGIATPTESAAMVVLYTLVLGVVIYRDLTFSAFLEAAVSAAMTTAVVMMTVATSQIFGSLAVLAGLVMVLNLVLGGVTPPVGLNLFVMARVAKVSVMDVFIGGWPYFAVLFLVLMLLTYVPWITLALPTLLMR